MAYEQAERPARPHIPGLLAMPLKSTVALRRVAGAAGLVLAAGCATSPPAALPLLPERSDAYEALSFYEGTWTILTKGHDGYRETCSWLDHNRRHIVCRARLQTASEVRESLGVYSYEPTRGVYRYHGFGSRGGISTEVGHVIADGFRFTSEHGTGADRVRTRFTIVQSANGRVNTVNEVAKGEGPWVVDKQLEYLRTRP